MWEKDLERGMLIATGLMIINMVVGFIATLVLATPMLGLVSGGGAFLEMGLFLILGGCMMSRQPLKDEARHNEDGSPTSIWKVAILGKQIVIAGFLLFIFAVIIATISVFVPI